MSEQQTTYRRMQALTATFCKLGMACLVAPLLLLTNAYADNTRVIHAEAVQFSSAVTTRSEGAMLVSVNAFNRQFDLALLPNSDLIENFDATTLPGIEVYKGSIVGADNSWVRLTRTGGKMVGVIHDGTEMFLIDSISDMGNAVSLALEQELQASGAASAMFRASDVVMSDICAVEVSHSNFANDDETLGSLVSEFDAMAAVVPDKAIRVLYMYDDALQAFATSRGSNAREQSLVHLNIVDGIFSNQVGVKLLLNDGQQIPGSGNINSGTLLQEFRQLVISRGNPGIAHLFTGRELDSTVAGIAYVGSICSATFGVGLSAVGKASRLTVVGGLIAAHEVGHNFGAPHDNQGGACAATPGNFLMNPSINGSDQFSACSLAQMASRISSNGSCLVPYNGGGNNSPELDNIGNQSNELGDTVNLSVTASDQDNDTLTFSASRLPTGLGISSTGSITGQANTAGSFQTVVTVSDGQATNSETFTWTVNGPQNRPPVVTSISSQSSTVGDNVSLAVQASDADNDTLTYSATGLPAGLQINSASGVISGRPSGAGRSTVAVVVSDGSASDTAAFIWTVTDTVQPLVISLGASSVRVGEDNTTIGVIVNLSRAATSPVSVSVFTRSGTATTGKDFYGFGYTLTFAAGETSKRLDLQIVDDSEIERTEIFEVRLLDPSQGTVGTSPMTVSIIDDDSSSNAPGYFSVSPVKVDENAGTANITVSLTKALTATTSVEIATSSGTANNGVDFFGVYETLKFSAGETSKTVPVTILNDTSIERTESFNIRLFNATGGARVGTRTASVSISDDD